MIEYTAESDLNTFPLNDQEKLLAAGTDSASHTTCTVSPELPNCAPESTSITGGPLICTLELMLLGEYPETRA